MKRRRDGPKTPAGRNRCRAATTWGTQTPAGIVVFHFLRNKFWNVCGTVMISVYFFNKRFQPLARYITYPDNSFGSAFDPHCQSFRADIMEYIKIFIHPIAKESSNILYNENSRIPSSLFHKSPWSKTVFYLGDGHFG